MVLCNSITLCNDEDFFTLLSQWMKKAESSESNDPHAAVLATADRKGFPNARVVLIKYFNKDGFVFFTNTQSFKGQEIKENPQASLCFHWKSLCRQLRVRGLVENYCPSKSDGYYASRPRGSQIGAWASKQSQKMESIDILKKSVQKYSALYDDSQEIPRPIWWSGFLIRPLYMEFWEERPYRLHERIVFSRETITGEWKKFMLYP